ncbi:MAG: hypothetical protein V1721_09085 [Pseudomonadota bacterium]
MTALYHGTQTGKDALFLEGFIVAGAHSGKSLDTGGQDQGFYVSLDPQVARAFAGTRTEEEARARSKYAAEKPVCQFGRGLMVQINTKVDSKNWDIDHEMSPGYSMALIENMRDFLPLAAKRQKSDDKKLLKAFHSAVDKKPDFFSVVYADFPTAAFFKYPRKKIAILYPETKRPSFLEGNRISGYFLQIVHHILRDSFPEEYQREKQRVLDEMVGVGTGQLKYIGSDPLKISRMYLKPELFDPRHIETLADWEVVYNATATSVNKKTGSSLTKKPHSLSSNQPSP